MSNQCFVNQVATEEILQRVTSVCAECYDELKIGEHIYYDMQSYRYLCIKCYDELIEKSNRQKEATQEEGGLFA